MKQALRPVRSAQPNILEQPEKSKIRQMLKLQLEMPSAGDWASTCVKDLNILGIFLAAHAAQDLQNSQIDRLTD